MGESLRLPHYEPACAISEHQLQPELQGAHGRAVLNVLDQAVVAAAVNAGAAGGLAVIRAEVQHRMVEDVEGIHAELCIEAFAYFEVLGYRHVVGEGTRTPIAVAARAAHRAACRERKWPGSRAREATGVCAHGRSGVSHRWDGREKGDGVRHRIQGAGSHLKR